MSDVSNTVGEKSNEDFNALSFERKLVELVEELRLRRNLEVENEKTLKSLIDEKYQGELFWDEHVRNHIRQREDLEQQIELLKRRLEDKVCVSDEDKAKQQVMNKTYSHELRMLKEELRVSKSEKLNLQKKIQELEGKLKLHDNFQEGILNQVSEVRKMMKEIFQESKELTEQQKKVMENVASAKLTFRRYDLCNQHLQLCVEIIGKKSEALKKELILSRSEAILLKQSVPSTKEKDNNHLEIETLQNKVLNLENLLLTSRKENEKTLNNFVESNKLLCKFMDKYSEIQERERQLTSECELLQDKLRLSQNELQKVRDEMKAIVEEASLKEKSRIERQRDTGVQTENILNEISPHSATLVESSDDASLASFVPKTMDENVIDEFKNGLRDLQQNALMIQSGMSVNNGVQSISMDQLCVNSSDKKITLSQVLKRKLEITKSGEQVELISMKKRFTENTSQSVIVINNGVEGDIQNKMLTSMGSEQPLCNNANSAISLNSPSIIKNEIILSCEANSQPLCLKSNEISMNNNSSSGIESKGLILYETNNQQLCNKLDQNVLSNSSSGVKTEISISCMQSYGDKSNPGISGNPLSSIENNSFISHNANGQSLGNKVNQNVSVNPPDIKDELSVSYDTNGQWLLHSEFKPDVPLDQPSVNILVDQKFLNYKKFSGQVNEDDNKIE